MVTKNLWEWIKTILQKRVVMMDRVWKVLFDKSVKKQVFFCLIWKVWKTNKEDFNTNIKLPKAEGKKDFSIVFTLDTISCLSSDFPVSDYFHFNLSVK